MQQDKPVILPTSCQHRIRDMLSALQRLQYGLEMYVAGIRESLGVPQDWVLDLQSMELKPRDKEE